MKSLSRFTAPAVAATLLAGLAAPAHADAPPAWPPVSSDQQEVRPQQAPVRAHAAPTVKHVRLRRTASGRRYRVRQGDTLWQISRAYLGSGRKWRAIFRVNRDRIHNPNLIYPGQLLRLPRHAPHHAPSPYRLKRSGHHTVKVSKLLGAARHRAGVSVQSHAVHGDSTVHKTRSVPAVQRPATPVGEAPTRIKHAETRFDTEPPSFTGDSFQGHRRVAGHFYTLKARRLVWADDGSPVIGEGEAEKQPESPKPQPEKTVSMAPDPEPTIQGHRRVKGSFYSREGNALIWADTGEPVHRKKAKPLPAHMSP